MTLNSPEAWNVELTSTPTQRDTGSVHAVGAFSEYDNCQYPIKKVSCSFFWKWYAERVITLIFRFLPIVISKVFTLWSTLIADHPFSILHECVLWLWNRVWLYIRLVLLYDAMKWIVVLEARREKSWEVNRAPNHDFFRAYVFNDSSIFFAFETTQFDYCLTQESGSVF